MAKVKGLKGAAKNTARAMGVRAAPTSVSFAIVEGDQQQPRLRDRGTFEAPKGFTTEKELAWIRQQFVDLIDQHQPNAIGIRMPESSARANNEGFRKRLRLEGVLFEVAGTRALPVESGPLVTIARLLGANGAKAAKRYVKEAEEFRGVDLKTIKEEQREAVLIAAAALPSSDAAR